MAIIKPILHTDNVQKLKNCKHHKFTNRLEHSLSVSYKGYLWAKRLGLHYEEVARAGLLHDLFYHDSCEMNTAREHLRNHPDIALENAEKLTDLSPLEKDMILSHMFLVSMKYIPKFKESYILSAVDKVVSINEVCTLPILYIFSKSYILTHTL